MAELRPAEPNTPLAAVLQRIGDVATLPQVAEQILDLVGDREADLGKLAAAISNDPALTARVLHLANSSAFGLQQSIASLHEAIVYLGIKQVRDLALAMKVTELFRGVVAAGECCRLQIGRHMVAVGLGARLIATRAGLPVREDVFLAGLLHDLGLILEDQYLHAPFRALLRQLDRQRDYLEQEREFLGLDHTTLGAAVAEKWRLPPMVCKAIRHHHQSKSYAGEDELLVRCVELANALCVEWGYFAVHRGAIAPATPQDLGLSLKEADLRQIRAELDEEMRRSSCLFGL